MEQTAAYEITLQPTQHLPYLLLLGERYYIEFPAAYKWPYNLRNFIRIYYYLESATISSPQLHTIDLTIYLASFAFITNKER